MNTDNKVDVITHNLRPHSRDIYDSNPMETIQERPKYSEKLDAILNSKIKLKVQNQPSFNKINTNTSYQKSESEQPSIYKSKFNPV